MGNIGFGEREDSFRLGIDSSKRIDILQSLCYDKRVIFVAKYQDSTPVSFIIFSMKQCL
jgi:hypothetical protein